MKVNDRYQFTPKHKHYINQCELNTYNIAEGAIRAGKTIDNVLGFAFFTLSSKDKIHLASGSSLANAKLNIGDANGFGLEYLFKNQCRWGKYKDNEALIIKGKATKGKERIIIFAGASKADSFKKIRGNSYGGWIATEINLHHDTFIKEAINRTAAAKQRRFFWDLNPDNPKAPIYTEYIDKYRETGALIGGCNYEHFTLNDNATISEQRKKEIAESYDKGSIWYQRDILGKRCVAEGLVYRRFADMVASGDKSLFVDDPQNLMEIHCGVDFGGNGSAHAFVASGITYGFNELVFLISERHEGSTSPRELESLFINFVERVLDRYGSITTVYCDSAEQVLIKGLRNAAIESGYGWLRIENALKEKINERIKFTNRMIDQNRLKLVKRDCETLIDAMRGATWNPKQITEDERLDDGTNDIDSLDASEYSFERFISLFMRKN